MARPIHPSDMRIPGAGLSRDLHEQERTPEMLFLRPLGPQPDKDADDRDGSANHPHEHPEAGLLGG